MSTPVTTSRPWKPTRVQQDVLDRLRDGWELLYTPDGVWIECSNKLGEPYRYVADVTVRALQRRGLITRSTVCNAYWVLA